MTKAENRAAGKAYQQEKLRKLAESVRADNAKADLAELEKLRQYLIFELKSRVNPEPLIDAIDDMAERLTGDRRALHTPGHSIG